MSERKHGKSEPSQRQLRVGEQIRHILAETLRRGHFHDPILFEAAERVTVSEVQVSPDMRQATAYVLTLGGTGMDSVLPALNDAAPVFQKEINKGVSMKFTPKIRFAYDHSFEEADKIERLLHALPKPAED